MADLAPFRGILYDPKRVDLSKVIAPPYDVIDPAMRAKLAADPHNVVRIDLPEAEAGADKYAAAARTFEQWQADGILRRDSSRAIYRYHQRFTSAELGGRTVTRKGFVCGIRLVPFSDGIVRPHERTLKGPKEDRFKLITASSAQFSQVFGLYSDVSGEVERMFRKWDHSEAPIKATQDGVEHFVWPITDAEMIGKLRRHMAPKHVYIADGHHRYETMLAVRDQMVAARDPGMYSSVQYGSIFLSSMDDPGLVVLPTHRVVHGLDGFSRDTLLERAREVFIVEKIAGGAADIEKIRSSVAEAVAHQPAFAAVFPDDPDAWRFTLSPNVSPASAGLTGHPSVARLDVTLLHGIVLERILGITPAAQEAQTNLRYVKDSQAALAAASAPGTQVVFLLGAPKVADVKHVADAGEIMPQKSTYFYPKLATGLVMAKIDPDEDLI